MQKVILTTEVFRMEILYHEDRSLSQSKLTRY